MQVPLQAYFKHPSFTQLKMLNGVIAARQIQILDQIEHLGETEFQVFSQWGEDGIIEWLVHHAGPIPTIFVEFGVENYTESNTRFLLMNRNWRGLIIDGSQKNIDYVRADSISWRHELHSAASFITTENINDTIVSAGFRGEIGILSVDIDGNDYWVLEAIECVNPCFIIVEYNSYFGDIIPVSIPYFPDFQRTQRHYSNLYYGASISAFCHLAQKRGYTLLGSNKAGSNAFFIRNDLLPRFSGRIRDMTARPSLLREARARDGSLSFLTGRQRTEILLAEPVVDVESGQLGILRDFGDIFSPHWSSQLGG